MKNLVSELRQEVTLGALRQLDGENHKIWSAEAIDDRAKEILPEKFEEFVGDGRVTLSGFDVVRGWFNRRPKLPIVGHGFREVLNPLTSSKDRLVELITARDELPPGFSAIVGYRLIHHEPVIPESSSSEL